MCINKSQDNYRKMKQIEEASDTLSFGSSANSHMYMYVLLTYAILMKLREILASRVARSIQIYPALLIYRLAVLL